jgi:hypothetical protein
MPSFTVSIDDTLESIAGGPNLTLLTGGVWGGATGKPSLSVSGVGRYDEEEEEHLSWISRSIDVDQTVELQVTDSDECSVPGRKVVRGGLPGIRGRLEVINEKVQSHEPAPPAPILYPGLYFVVQINSEAPIEAHLNGFELIQTKFSWSCYGSDIDFHVMSISVKADGSTTHRDWLRASLAMNDRVKITAKNAPNCR